jgi:hypothetical protein
LHRILRKVGPTHQYAHEPVYAFQERYQQPLQ